MGTDCAVALRHLTKRYGDFVALDDISLELEPGKVYGLLGRNGAGKTTLLNILTARIQASGGEPLVFGGRAFENIELLKKICYIEEKGFYASAIRISDALRLCGGLYPNWDQRYCDELIELFELNPRKKYKQLSRGMESALGLVIGLASRAELTIFDEPSLGLDAVIRERFYDAVIDDIAEHPRTVIISTHLIDEVSRLFEDVVIIDRGKLLMRSGAAELKASGFYLSGRQGDVESAAKNCTVLHKEHFGGSTILSVYAPGGLRDLPAEVEVSPMPLQKLFVHLIDPEIHDMLQKDGVLSCD